MPSPFSIETAGSLGKDAHVLLVFTCPKCRRKTKRDSRQLRPNQAIQCSCEESTFTVTTDGLQQAQDALDRINQAVKGLGDAFRRLSR